MRDEVQAFALTSGLRLDVYVLYGGLVAEAVWRRHDLDGNWALSEAEAAGWATALADGLRVTLDARRCRLTAEPVSLPDYVTFTSCAAPLVIRAEMVGRPPRGRPVDLRIAVAPPGDVPLLARVLLVAPAAVAVATQRQEPAALVARLTWPPASAPADTRLPQITPPNWFYLAPTEVDWGAGPVAPSAGRESLVQAPPARGLSAPGAARGVWPAALLVLVAVGLAWFQRNRLGRTAGGA